MDSSLLHTLNNFFVAHDGIEDSVIAYERIAQFLFIAILVALFFAAGRERRGDARRTAVAAGASTAVALVAAQIISRIVDRPRPFVADPGSVHLFAKHVADASFPSDHATAAFAIATAILLRDRRWGIPVIVLAAILAVGRVAMAVHYPSDVLGGAVLGALVAVLLWTPWPRQRLDGLADLLGAVFDSIGRKLFGALRPKPA